MCMKTMRERKRKLKNDIFEKRRSNRTGSFFEIILKKKNPRNYLFPGKKRRRPDLNRWILVLQTIALPLGYDAI